MFTPIPRFLVCLFLPCAVSTAAQTAKKSPAKSNAPAASAAKTASPPVEERDAAQLTKKLSEKYAAVKRFAFEGDLEVARQVGEDPKEELIKAAIKLEVAPGGKFVFHVKKEGADYSLISDGNKSWAYVPAVQAYTEREAASGGKPFDPQALPLVNILEGTDDITERFAEQIMPVLTRTLKSPAISFMRGVVLTVIGEKNSRDQQSLLYLTVNASTLAIPRLTWLQPAQVGDTKYMVRSDIRFKNARFDADVPDSDFSFNAPADAKKSILLRFRGEKTDPVDFHSTESQFLLFV